MWISWHAQYFEDLEVQIYVAGANVFVDLGVLGVKISWYQSFVELEVLKGRFVAGAVLCGP